MTGAVDLSEVKWDAGFATLSGQAKVIGGDPFRIALAGNGMKVVFSSTDGATTRLEKHAAGDGYVTLAIDRAESGHIPWTVRFTK